MKNEKYQGWTNWDTWSVNLWYTNDNIAYGLGCWIVGDNKLSMLHKRNMLATTYRELTERLANFGDNANIKNVNWREIIESWDK